MSEFSFADREMVDALRAWHRYEHGDRAGAIRMAKRGLEVPEEVRDVFAAVREVEEWGGALEEISRKHGHDSRAFTEAAVSYLRALQNAADQIVALQGGVEEEEEARPAPRSAPRSAGAPPAVDPKRVAAAKAAAAAFAGMAAGPAMAGGGMGGGMMGGGPQSMPDDSLPSAGSMVDLGSVFGMPPAMGGK